MISFDYINEFLILAETLNYSKAAQEAFITQPALSRHIASLEESMGVKLFERTTREVSLTEAGKCAYESFCAIRNQFESLQVKLSALESKKKQRLTLCCPNYWMGDYIEPIIMSRDFIELPYSVRLEAHQPTDSLSRVQKGASDMFFGLGLPTDFDESIEMKHFIDEPACVLMASSDPRLKKGSVRLAELEGDTVVLIDEGNRGYDAMNRFILRLFDDRGIRIGGVEYANQVETLGATILECRGVSVMPAALRHMKRSYLSSVPLDDEFQFPLCFYYRKDTGNPAIPALLDVANRYLENLESDKQEIFD